MILDELNTCKYNMENMEHTQTNLSNKLNDISQNINSLEYKLKCVLEAKQYYKKAIDLIYEKSIVELKNVINSALSYIFGQEKCLQVDIEISDKRGKSLTLIINQEGKKVNLRYGMGMGVKCVISCILQIYYLQCKNSKKLFLDEAYSNISKEYISNFFDFLSKLCQKLEFTIVLITHDERFIQYADRVYEISDGYVTLIKG